MRLQSFKDHTGGRVAHDTNSMRLFDEDITRRDFVGASVAAASLGAVTEAEAAANGYSLTIKPHDRCLRRGQDSECQDGKKPVHGRHGLGISLALHEVTEYDLSLIHISEPTR